MQNSFLDSHSHMIPLMDDGSSSMEESIKMLETSYAEGVSDVILTSHFYPADEPIDKFLERRSSCLKTLLEGTKELKNIPSLHLGAEVAYYYGISNSKRIAECRYLGTPYILIEMPFEHWEESMVDEILSFEAKTGLKPIIAHFERFLPYSNEKWIKKLNLMGIPLQSNAEFFINKETSRLALKYLKKGYISLLGSDAHNMRNRKPNMKEALDIISLKHLKYLEPIDAFNSELIKHLEKIN